MIGPLLAYANIYFGSPLPELYLVIFLAVGWAWERNGVGWEGVGGEGGIAETSFELCAICNLFATVSQRAAILAKT